ncbi:flagellar basal body-associated protein FliL [Pseudomonas lalucatii]|uniref:Flagellar protein FliL n=1 Tax=Pseudomonas lalucatii TaxID=1424203 RepID=A0ABS5Q177_9PSED|nr:flagellar basal body-associated FliL family protein [Pseudomonas lalucatii]MBS7662471.1 flagellar basal body-associated protein FliL [Pseudomonas lalucatii]MBS7690269.1 flagellar basal body-associated protein FliL [Pseudomonas lalucatii]MBS7725894.1 flagellar basal body-associated protein FliL [Pseudomonas lalucatii]QVM88861.1 flagellar basal body-associated protein FliL [Pseudomonas lalucatii]
MLGGNLVEISFVKVLIAALLALSLPLSALAEEEEEKAAAPQVIYHSLFPALVGNFGSGPKLKFYKADVALRVSGPEAQAKVKHHEPLIRNQLVMLFAQQTEEGLSAPDAKEALRQEALQQVQQALTQEEGQPVVEDLLFNNLILQR